MVTRLNGFSGTGIDIDETVSKLMQAARIPMDKLKQKKQLIEWQRDDYRTINSKILDFRNLAFNMKLQATYLSKKSTSADESAVSVSSDSTAIEGNYTLKINKLATSASVTSAATGKASASATLGSIDAGFTNPTTLTVSGEKGTATVVVKPTDTIAQVVAAVNGKSAGTGVNLSYDAKIDKFFFVSSNTGSNAKIGLKMGSDSDTQNLLETVFKIHGDDGDPSTVDSAPVADAGQRITGGQSFTSGVSTLIDDAMTSTQKLHIEVDGKTVDIDISKTTTIGKVIDQINSSDIGKAGVSAYLDSDNKLAFFNPDKTKTVTFGDATSDSYNLLSKLGLDASDPTPSLQPTVTDDIDFSSFTIVGSKAEIEFNGAAAQYDTNTFAINGMTFTAKKEGGPAVNVTTTRDVDAVFNSIKGFIDKYNELIDTVNGKLSEKRYRDFNPLTEDERKELKEDQIKSWEEKAKSGLLRSDALLTRGLMDFRTSFSSIIEGLPVGNARSLSQIGISSSIVVGKSISGGYQDNGKIYMDDAKLKKAIAETPDEVMALFMANDGVKDSAKGDGLATRLYDKADALIKNITDKAGASTSVDTSYRMGKTTKDINKQIDAMGLKLDALETRYYKQFTAMEKYINQMNMQSAQLSQQFA